MKNDLKRIRDADLRKLYDNLVRCKGLNIKVMKRGMIISTFMNAPAPRFYITEKMVERYILAYMRGEYITKNPLKRKMIDDLVDNYYRITSSNKYLTRSAVWYEVARSPAKSFYIDRRTIINILFKDRWKK